jgi:hypothetical protein
VSLRDGQFIVALSDQTPASTAKSLEFARSEISLIANNTPSAPGTVPAPILAPRKKRHRSDERLTEEEKRANHIASEQKRRHNIRIGFQALSMLVPSLKSDHSNVSGNVVNELMTESNSKMRKNSDLRLINSSGPSKYKILSEGTCSHTNSFNGNIVCIAIDFIRYLQSRNQRLTNRITNLQQRI